MIQIQTILRCFPTRIYQKIDEFFLKYNKNINYLEEIRIRVAKPILIKLAQKEFLIDYKVTSDEMVEILQHICENSIYAYQTQICNGYITMQGGHRIGITGNVVMKEQKVVNINYISSLNFRIAKQIIGCSNKMLPYVINKEENTIYHTLIVSPPGAGKTTILRDFIRQISSGIPEMNFCGLTVGVVDERGEIAAMYRGIPQNDVGERTDVLDNVPKSIGMKMLIRSMSPDVIVADEIGTKEDVESICYAICCGIKGIFTAHGSTLEELKLNPALKQLMDTYQIERILFLGNSPKKPKGEIAAIYELSKMEKNYIPCSFFSYL